MYNRKPAAESFNRRGMISANNVALSATNLASSTYNEQTNSSMYNRKSAAEGKLYYEPLGSQSWCTIQGKETGPITSYNFSRVEKIPTVQGKETGSITSGKLFFCTGKQQLRAEPPSDREAMPSGLPPDVLHGASHLRHRDLPLQRHADRDNKPDDGPLQHPHDADLCRDHQPESQGRFRQALPQNQCQIPSPHTPHATNQSPYQEPNSKAISETTSKAISEAIMQ
jgi:hypothetical protein